MEKTQHNPHCIPPAGCSALRLLAGLALMAIALMAAPAARAAVDPRVEAADVAVSRYDFDEAEKILADIDAAYRRNRRKNPLPEGMDEVRTRMDRLRAMMDRVEAVQVIDSVVISKADFLDAYGLSSATGALVLPQELPAKPQGAQGVVFASQDGSTFLWGAPEGLMMAEALGDGSLTAPEAVKGSLGKSASFPFMLTDGVTLYYAADDPEGAGGLDIMMTRRDGDTFLLPQNVGMPYNSPADDYLMAIDETRGLGWWATDRNHIPGKVTVYTFIPSDMRSNYPPDTPGLASLARLASIRTTWKPGADYSQLLKGADSATAAAGEEFFLAVPGRGVITSLDGFSSPTARELMVDLLSLQDRYDLLAEELAEKRLRYRNGAKNLGPEILEAEAQLDKWAPELRRLTNDVIRAEAPQ